VITVPSGFVTSKVSVESSHSPVGDVDGDRLGNSEPHTPHVNGQFSAAPSKSHLKSNAPTQAQVLPMSGVPLGFVTSKVSVVSSHTEGDVDGNRLGLRRTH